MAPIVILAVLAAVVALLIGVTTGNDRYAEMSEEEFEAEAKRASLLGAAVMGLQKVLEPKHVEYMMQRDKRVEGDSADASDPPPDEPADRLYDYSFPAELYAPLAMLISRKSSAAL